MKKSLIWVIAAAGLVAVVTILINTDSGTDERRLTPVEIAAQKEAQQEFEAEQGIVSAPEALRYENARYGFSFEKPEGYTVGVIPEGEGEVVLVQRSEDGSRKKEEGSRGTEGFQIYVTPLSEPVRLTPQLIQSELPGTAVRSPLAIRLDGKADGIMFGSNAEAFGGSSYEIWFVQGGYLYQASAYAEFEEQLKAIVGTLRFN